MMSRNNIMKKFRNIIILSVICLASLVLCIRINYSKTYDEKPKKIKTKIVSMHSLSAKIDLKDIINLSDIIIEGEVVKSTLDSKNFVVIY